MEVIGEKLKTSREEKGLSLEEVSSDLKVSVKDLTNIESGKREDFSSIFELREIIKNYAKYLLLDSEKIVEEFNEYMYESTSKIPVEVIERISKQKEKEESKREAISPYTIDNHSKNNKKVMLIGTVCAIIILLVIVICIISGNSNDTSLIAFSSLV